jgi:hypothetical protein
MVVDVSALIPAFDAGAAIAEPLTAAPPITIAVATRADPNEYFILRSCLFSIGIACEIICCDPSDIRTNLP